MALTDTWLRAVRGAEKPYKKSDAGGLYVLVQPDGKRYWRLAYRFAGKQKSLALGTYPLVSLKEAREARDTAKKQLLVGQDPGDVRKAEKAAQKATTGNTFENIARDWHEAQKHRWTVEHAGRVIRRLERDIFPRLGGRPIADIEPPELLEVLRQVELRGALDIVKREREHVGQIFRFAIASGKARRDPTADLRGALKAAPPKKHRATMPRNELPAFLRQLDAYDGDATTRLALQLIIITIVRTKELRGAEWQEFEGLDGGAPMWRIPSWRMKMPREHLVPLPSQAVEILIRLRPLTGHSPYLFPSGGKKGFMSENTMLYALYRMGYHSKATVHGFRGVASTVLNEAGFHPDWIERQLAHDEANKVRAAYNSAQYLPDRRRMLQWYADHLETVKNKSRDAGAEMSMSMD
jgi:integrase